MDGNLAMSNRITEEPEKVNNFWMDVYYYMEENDCNKETAIKAIEPLYNKIGISKGGN